jgi:hypothetical protein
MTGLFVGLCYLGVLALVVGCFVYLFVTRPPSRAGRPWEGPSAPPAREWAPPSAELANRAEALSGTYRLLDLERIFEQLGAIEAWGMVVELNFTTAQAGLGQIQMIVFRHEVELCTPILDPSYTDPFRRAATEMGVQARPGYTEDQYCVDVKGTWPAIAGIIRSMIRSVHGVGDNEEVRVLVFN